MAKDTESDEDDIWNYKSISKVSEAAVTHEKGNGKQRRSTSSTSAEIPPKTLSRKSTSAVVRSSQQGCKEVKESDLAKVKGNNERITRSKHQVQGNCMPEIIDVDLEFEYAFDSSSRSVPKHKNSSDGTNSSQEKSSTKCHKRCRASLSSSRKPGVKPKPSTRSTSSKGSAKPFGHGSPSKSTSKSPRTSQDSARSSQGKTESNTTMCHNIENFFSPSGVKKSAKRRSSEAVDSFLDSSDDELIFVRLVREEKTVDQHDGGENHARTDDDAVNEDNTYSKTDSNTGTDTQNSVDGISCNSCQADGENLDQDTVAETVENEELNTEMDSNETSACACKTVVDVVVVSSEQKTKQTNLHSSDMNDDSDCLQAAVVTGYDETGTDCGKLEGGFLAQEDLFSETCSSSSSGEVKNNHKPSKFSSQSDDRNPEFKSPSLASVTNTDIPDKLEATLDDVELSVACDDAGTNAQSLLISARKQTSLFSFFKAKFSGSSSNVSSHVTHKNPMQYTRITSRPGLHRDKTMPALRSASSSSWSAGPLRKPGFVKSASEAAVDKLVEPPVENQKQGFEKGKKRQCPFYKKMPGTAITVDAFGYGEIPGCEAYILTHFHYDHYGGLTKRFAQPIYCSKITGNLVESRLGVHEKWINRLPMWKPCQVAGVTVTLMEANHCPGAVIILFELKDGRKILHTGDFRACPEMEEYSLLKGTVISELYLDTTYCNPSYAFPPQSEVINFVVSLVAKHIAVTPHTLIVCGAYTIGKEKIFTAIAKLLDSKICVMTDKKKVLDCLDDAELKSRVTLDWSKGQVHILPMGKLNQQSLFEHLARHPQFQSILAFSPTGWSHSNKIISLDNLRPKWSTNGVTLYGVPYSEHSSFLELKRFVQYLRPKKILPTVNNGNPASRKKMEDIFNQWMQEKSQCPKSPISSSQQTKLSAWMS